MVKEFVSKQRGLFPSKGLTKNKINQATLGQTLAVLPIPGGTETPGTQLSMPSSLLSKAHWALAGLTGGAAPLGTTACPATS